MYAGRTKTQPRQRQEWFSSDLEHPDYESPGRAEILRGGMTRVLFIAYHFPPIGGGGVQRSAKFARYLPDFGYEPVVLTGPGNPTARWTPPDATLAEETAEVAVERIDAIEPNASAGWRSRAERWARLSSTWSRWWVDGITRVGARVGNSADLIFATMSPYSSATAAGRLATALGKPWVADLRDPWALDEMMVLPSGLHRRLELRRMESALSSAAAIVMNCPEAGLQIKRHFPRLRDKLIVTIPNGYDANDFASAPPHRDDSSFRIVHTGHLHAELGLVHRRSERRLRLLGGRACAVDILARSHFYLLNAVNTLLEKKPGLEAKLEVHLAGALSESDRMLASSVLARPQVLQMPGYLPHRDSIDLVRSADVLFLPLHDVPPGYRARTVPGKTYEYLASGRPILAAVPEGDARDLLAQIDTAFLCRPTDADGMAAVLRGLAENARAGGDKATVPAVLEPYERRRLTARLASVFDAVLGRDAARKAEEPQLGTQGAIPAAS